MKIRYLFNLAALSLILAACSRDENTQEISDVNGQKISDTCKIIADKTSDNAQERTFRCNFNLPAWST